MHVTIDGNTIDTTLTHPFYVPGYGFKPAGELTAGDKVLLLDGGTAVVEAVATTHLDEPVKVYNFEVADWHTYYVSEQGVLVHNMCKISGGSTHGSSSSSIVQTEGGTGARNILNVGAGDSPIPCATNIDISPNTAGVIYGDVNDLSQFASGQFDHIISMNPYNYNLLESDASRVLKEGGVMTVTGNYSNKYFKKIFNASPETLSQAGFEIVSKGEASSIFVRYGGKVTGGVRKTQGTPVQIILRKVGIQ